MRAHCSSTHNHPLHPSQHPTFTLTFTFTQALPEVEREEVIFNKQEEKRQADERRRNLELIKQTEATATGKGRKSRTAAAKSTVDEDKKSAMAELAAARAKRCVAGGVGGERGKERGGCV